MTNLEKLRKAMAAAGRSAVLISSPTNLYWLSGFTGSFAYVVVTADRSVFITDSRYTIQASEEVEGFEITSFATPKTGAIVLGECLKDLGVQSIGFESVYTTVSNIDLLKSKLPQFEFEPLGDMLENLRMVKSELEISRIRAACELTDACFDHILRLVQPGVSEFEIQLELEFFFRRNGASCAFEPIIVSGANSARPHGHATEKPLEFGDFVTFDFGAKLDGYCADMTRTVVVGRADDRTKEIYNQVLKAELGSMDVMKIGALAVDIDAHARTILNEKDLAKYFGHGLGHGLGILVHDTGRLGSGSTTVLEAGQVWTVEPGVYIEGFGGCRIEDDVVIRADGVEILNRSTKELLELG